MEYIISPNGNVIFKEDAEVTWDEYKQAFVLVPTQTNYVDTLEGVRPVVVQ